MLIRTLPYVSADAAGLPIADIPTDLERAIFAHSRVKRWWRASADFGAAGWRCLKSGAALVPERSGNPDPVTISAYNGRPALRFASSEDQLWDGGAGLVPAGSAHSIVMVGRAGPNDNAFMMGGTSAAGVTTMLVHQSTAAASGFVSYVVNAPTPNPEVNNRVGSAANLYSEAGPLLMIGSYDAAAVQRVGLRVNRGLVDIAGNPSAATGNNAGANLHVGGVNATGAAILGPIDGGEIAEILVLDTALHIDTGLREQIEAMLHARYSLW